MRLFYDVFIGDSENFQSCNQTFPAEVHLEV